ncbi:VOC family protein [Rhodococcus sp. NPDC058521]|uniref:VOC family protein n=1 Tax=Rhodococcus sp. NPDC058521 TaxID=3346536 RepID=UPI0036592922
MTETEANDLEESSFYHVCFTVPDLTAAMDELTRMVGVSWGEPTESQLGPWPYTLVFSTEHPHFELVSSVEGSPWYSEKPGFHHIGWWSNCLDRTMASWAAHGGESFFDGRGYGRNFGYVDALASGVLLEAVGMQQREAFVRRWQGGS